MPNHFIMSQFVENLFKIQNVLGRMDCRGGGGGEGRGETLGCVSPAVGETNCCISLLKIGTNVNVCMSLCIRLPVALCRSLGCDGGETGRCQRVCGRVAG